MARRLRCQELPSAFRLRDGGGDFLYQINDREPERAVVDRREGVGEPERARIGNEPEQRARGIGVGAFEQRGDRDAEDSRDLGETPGPDPVVADLVFLQLLKRDAQPARQLRLGHSPRHAPDANVAADSNVDGARFLRGLPLSFGHRARRVAGRSTPGRDCLV